MRAMAPLGLFPMAKELLVKLRLLVVYLSRRVVTACVPLTIWLVVPPTVRFFMVRECELQALTLHGV